jgi:uncharacterized protein YjeT (DUF2065 family)
MGLLWTTIAFYLNNNLGELRRFGTGFLIVYAIFLALFFQGMYRTLREHRPAQAQALAKLVNRVLRDAGIVALAGFALERLSEDRLFWRVEGSVPGGALIVEYGFPYAVKRMISSSTNPPQRIVVEFVDNIAKNVVVLGLIALAFVEVPLISYEIYKWKQRKENSKG